MKQTFVASTVLTAAQLNSLQANDYNQTVSTKTASYTLVAADAGTRVVMNSASATTITVNTSLFSAGDTLFLQNIGAGVCTVTAGTATVSSAGPLAIPQNGSGILYFTSAGVSIFYPSAGASGTKIGQVVSTTKTDTFTTSSTSYVDVTGLTVSITPTLNTSKILVLFDGVGAGATAAAAVHARLMRDSTAIDIGDAASSRTQVTTGGICDSAEIFSISANFLDSPATTSAVTYKVQIKTNGTTIAINRSVDDSNISNRVRGASTITVLEVIV